MKKYLLILILTLTACFTTQAQQLVVKKVPDVIAYNGEGKYGIIIINAHEYFKLTFSTNYDGDKGSMIENTAIRKQGNQMEYTLTFDVEKVQGAMLRISSPEHSVVQLPIDVKPNGAVKYFIDDPTIAEVQSQEEKAHLIRGDKYFTEASYDFARDEYAKCLGLLTAGSDIDSAYVAGRINTIDEIKALLVQIPDANTGLDYKKLLELYGGINRLNPADKVIREKYSETVTKYDEECKDARSRAELLYRLRKDRAGTVAAFDRVAKLGREVDVYWAQSHRSEIDQWKNLLSRHTLTYEYQKDAVFGFSTGNYNIDNSSGYFTLRFNPKIFDLINLGDADTLNAEVNLSFGFTVRLIHFDLTKYRTSNVGLWLFFGPGATLIAKAGPKASETWFNEDDQTEYEIEQERFDYPLAVSPEAGLLLKIPLPGTEKHQLALRYTLQYRFFIDKKYNDEYEKTKSVIGIGFTF
ncbi:MAG: hypothetical protein LBI58_02940 [Tannerellaceae bacterium]|jgi:hypothetical protein|nr:hypothetical protein [Tannerellaceae bacterium]